MRELILIEKGEDQSALTAPDMLWHDRERVINTWMQHKIHHSYPRSGGYDDQDEYLMKDWQTMNLYYARAQAGVYTPVISAEEISGLAGIGGE